MTLRRPTIDELRLTGRDLAIAQGIRDVPTSILNELRGDDAAGEVSAKTRTYRQITTRMRAEREYREEVARFSEYENLAQEVETLRGVIHGLEDELHKANVENERLRKRLEQKTAAPALAVSSEPTGR